MAEVIELKQGKRFTLQEANTLLPIVKKITAAAVEKVEKLQKRIEAVDPDAPLRFAYEQEFHHIIDHWALKIQKLGCTPKGLWLVDFDNGSGFYCWHHPEEEVAFYHTYDGGFKGRQPIV